MKSQKYGISPDEVEEKSLSSQRFKLLFNFKRIEMSRAVSDRLDRYDRKKYSAKKKKLRSDLQIDKKVLVLSESIKKKSAPGKFYKQTVQNIPYFNKKNHLYNNKKQTVKKKAYYWLKNEDKNQHLPKRFQRTELFALINNFAV